jgi:hypothetical protein
MQLVLSITTTHGIVLEKIKNRADYSQTIGRPKIWSFLSIPIENSKTHRHFCDITRSLVIMSDCENRQILTLCYHRLRPLIHILAHQ